MRDPRTDLAQRSPGAGSLLSRRRVRHGGRQYCREEDADENVDFHRRIQ